MFTICLEALISGVISVSSLGLSVDYNDVIYSLDNQSYTLYDKYNVMELCKDEQRFANVNTKSSDIVNQITTIE